MHKIYVRYSWSPKPVEFKARDFADAIKFMRDVRLQFKTAAKYITYYRQGSLIAIG